MDLDNLISVTFTDDELSRVDSAMSEIESIFLGKVVNLTPKQRQLYGRVAYEMEIWVEKALTIVWSIKSCFCGICRTLTTALD
jgi:hypothetical protein